MTDLNVKESPLTAIAGETLTYSLTWLGASSLSSPSAKVYFKGSDVTTTAMPSGSDSSSGDVQTLKPLAFSASWVNNYIVVAIQCSVDSNTEIRKLKIHVQKPSDE